MRILLLKREKDVVKIENKKLEEQRKNENE